MTWPTCKSYIALVTHQKELKLANLLTFMLFVGAGLGTLFFLVFSVAATTPPLNTFFVPRFIRVFGLFVFLVSFVFFVDACRALLLYVSVSWGVVNG